jgi:uncharacterized protein YecT (DUF1311 family)
MLVLAVMTLECQPASAEMFGADYKPCGDKQSTLDIVACVNAKTKVWDARLNEAYRGVQKRINEGQRHPLVASEQAWIKYRDSNCGFYGGADGTSARSWLPSASAP